jgi:DNA-binding CsgD family transcriptional regulator
MTASSLAQMSWTDAADDRGQLVSESTAKAAGQAGAIVSDPAVDVYRHAARRGAIGSLDAVAAEVGRPVQEICTAVSKLIELRLLQTDGLGGNRLLPTDPELAVTRLISPLERETYRRRDLTDQLRGQIEAIARPQCGSIDGLDGVAEIRGLFKVASEVCRHELLVLRPSHADEELLDELLETCYNVLDRGVAVRVISPHSSRAGFSSRAKAKRLVDGGAEIRTLSRVPQAAVVFDGSLAVMLNLSEVGGSPGARRVRDQAVVRFVVDLFDQLWEGATAFASGEPGYADALDNLQQSILRLMAQGLTDEVVARRLRMSVRTCRRHIAALLQNLDSVSRFQAGVQAARQLSVPTAVSA